jgi:hypothetical protein
MDRYVGVMDPDSTPGSDFYGTLQTRAFIPTSWDLFDGETVTFQFPTGNVPFYDPNLTPIGAEGTKDQFVVNFDQLALLRTHPPDYGNWDPVAKTWTITGPTTTGVSVGNPGPDGTPGTPDDDYPDESGAAIYFIALPEPGSAIALLAGSGLLAMLYRRRLRRSGII